MVVLPDEAVAPRHQEDAGGPGDLAAGAGQLDGEGDDVAMEGHILGGGDGVTAAGHELLVGTAIRAWSSSVPPEPGALDELGAVGAQSPAMAARRDPGSGSLHTAT